ncbi:hypothetical protein [uncultured Methanobrevibacter sp.]|uniref:hypothetical protein n=1 Tax=uncultured Methanobrevibacter sp. TaxID=253161 RepID=UPI0025ED8187|nr:hypothetical protein [uncultured Methanobrevibacter sp.]
MGNTLKFVSGIILFVIGVVISYEVIAYGLIEVLLMVGFLISIVGIILIISYFVDSNAEKTSGLIKDFLDSKDINAPSINFSKRKEKSNGDNNGPLIVRPSNDDYDYGEDIDDSGLWEYYESDKGNSISPREFFDAPEIDESKAVLRVVNQEEKEIDLDKELNFTPVYEKPIKVTRKPKKRSTNHIYDDVPVINETADKTEEIKRALSQPEVNLESTTQPRDIEIDINNPERLPVPESLRGNVLLGNELITSNDAFEQLAVNVNKEIMLEIPSLNNLSDRFLSHVPTIYSRVIIDEFDLSDISYTVLIASLLKQGVHIKTVPKVHAINLITDDSHAMIISDGYTVENSEYGAIYDDRKSISNIRADFEKTWDIASNLDETVILNSIGGVA